MSEAEGHPGAQIRKLVLGGVEEVRERRLILIETENMILKSATFRTTCIECTIKVPEMNLFRALFTLFINKS